MQIALMVEGQAGLTWATWKDLAARVDDWGWSGLYRSDHFTMPSPPDENSLEMIVSLTYLADHTRQVHFGPLVAPVSFRDPAMLARQAAHIDDLSGGRMILGVGAGWQVREHEMFGYPLLEPKARLERFAEGLEVIWLLLKSDGPVSFEGRWYSLREAEILPRPFKTRLLVGGNGITRTLPLAARYADIWNGVQLTPAKFGELASLLDRLIYDAGREPGAVRKTAATFLFFGRDRAALEQRVARLRHRPGLQDLPLEQLLTQLHDEDGSITGLAEQVIPQIQAYASAGAEELILQILDADDLDGIEFFSRNVLPHLS
jgi:alkanesulfonate monooxygenase SsuD/methylene tetrahydromethanopterin reductase-like flavin-dependent oxidoreductase (luciferase family)